MAASMTMYIPTSEFAKSLTNVNDFADLARIALNFDLLNWETGLAAAVVLKIDADNRASSGTLSYPQTWAMIWVRNWPQLVGGTGAVNFKSTTSSSFTGLVSRGAISFATANGGLMMVKLGGGGTTNRYWQIEIDTALGIAPEVALVMIGTGYDVNDRWNYGGPVIRDDLSLSELTLGRSVQSRRVRRALNMKIETRIWQDAKDADAANLQNAFDAAGGPYLPFILQDYDTPNLNQHRICRFDPQTHGNGAGQTRTQKQSDINDFSITFRDIARLEYGSIL